MPNALSILVPNFNYGAYIGETLRSALADAGDDVEVIVCDNASTDNSVAEVQGLNDARIQLHVNPCNVGFAGNLERVASFASGRRMLLLSSDDRIRRGALPAYRKLQAALGTHADLAIWGAATTTIDGAGTQTGEVLPDPKLWRGAAIDPTLSDAVGLPVRGLPAAQLLRRSLELLRTPLPFASTCYSRQVFDAAGGYSGGRLINPDKWFLWKALGVAEMAYVIDAPLFDYRVHGGGQGAQEAASGALKHLTDEYVATFALPANVLATAQLERETLAHAFIEQDIALRGLVAVANGQRTNARRMINFGLAAYPQAMLRNPKVWALRALVAMGPLGTLVARSARDRAQAEWAARESR